MRAIVMCMNDGATPVDRSFLQRLRHETHDAHMATEEAVDIMAATATLADYRVLLGRFYGLYKPFEDIFQPSPLSERPDLQLDRRIKSPWLELDLKILGLTQKDIAALCLCRALPPLHDVADFYGSLYVLEGSSLGGQLIARHLAQNLDIHAENGGLFFNGYQSGTGMMWRQFGDIVCDVLREPRQQDRAIAAANATFGVFRDWMGKSA